MACKSKTFINDLGSDVVAEITSQLNTALSVTPLALLAYPSADAGSDATAAPGITTTPSPDKGSFILFTAHEDCFVTSIKMVSVGAALAATAPATTSLVILQVPATWSSDNGAGVVVAHDQLVVANGVNGNSVAIALGAGVATYTVRYLSDGSIFDAGNGRDAGQLFDLFDQAEAAAGGAVANEYQGSLISGTHGVSPAVDLPAGGFSMAAGESLVMGLNNATGAVISLMASVGYRPVKDSIALSPAVPAKAFNSVDR